MVFKTIKLIVVIFAIVFVATLFFPLLSESVAPRLINFQGRLTDQQGNPLDGTYNLKFCIYPSADPNTSPLWIEEHTDVSASNGLVNVLLGSIQNFDEPVKVTFDQERFLGITIDCDHDPNTKEPEMTPRQRILPAIFAYNAENAHNTNNADNADKLDGKDSSEFTTPERDAGRPGVVENLYEGNVRLIDKYGKVTSKWHIQEFKTSGTWIRPEGVEMISVLLVGGGGGGGGCCGIPGTNGGYSNFGTLLTARGGAAGSVDGGNGGGTNKGGGAGGAPGEDGDIGYGSIGGAQGGGGGGRVRYNNPSPYPPYYNPGHGGDCSGFGKGGLRGEHHYGSGGGGGSYGDGAAGAGVHESGRSVAPNSGGGGSGSGCSVTHGVSDSGGGGGGGEVVVRYISVTENITVSIGAGGAGGPGRSDTGEQVGGDGGSGYCQIMWYE